MATVNELAEQLLQKGVVSSRMDAKKMAEQMLAAKSGSPKIVKDIHDSVRDLQRELADHKKEVVSLKEQVQDLHEKQAVTEETIRNALKQDLLPTQDPIEAELSEGSPDLQSQYVAEEQTAGVEQEIKQDISSSMHHDSKTDTESDEVSEELDRKEYKGY